MRGEPIPNDPIYNQPYPMGSHHPRTLLPDTPEFENTFRIVPSRSHKFLSLLLRKKIL